MPNYSFVDFDFDFANLYLFDVVQKEMCLAKFIQIINLSLSLTSNYIMDKIMIIQLQKTQTRGKYCNKQF